MKQHGIGVGYRYPHDYEGADVDQQYLPDELGRPALLPADRPGLRVDASPPGWPPGPRRGPPRRPPARRPRTNPEARGEPAAPATSLMKKRETNRKKLADTEKARRELGGRLTESRRGPMVGWQSPAPGTHLVGPQRAMDRIPPMARTSFSAPEAHIVVSTDGYFDVYPTSARTNGDKPAYRGVVAELGPGHPRRRRPARRPPGLAGPR